MKERAVMSWSGGKDSALALQDVLKDGCEIVALLTAVTEPYDRVSIHGVRRALLEEQAASLALPLEQVLISAHPSNSDYEAKMLAALRRCKREGVDTVVFGDIFLEDIRAYREALLARLGMRARFPLWWCDSAALAHRFIDDGFKAVTVCTDSRALPQAFVGRAYDRRFLADLPQGVDPCGENGEFHTFVYDGPPFKERVAHRPGEVVFRDERFYYFDLMP